MSYKTPNIPLIPNPIGLDYAIQQIQIKLGGISWLDYSFGKSIRIEHEPDSKKYFPAVYDGSSEYFSVEFNDNLQAQSFFIAGDGKMIDFEENQYNTWKYDLDLVVWWNYKKIDPIKDFLFIEELKRDVVSVLSRGIPGIDITYEVEGVTEDFYKIFKEYSFTEAQRQYIMHPFGAFRISGTVKFDEQCSLPS